MATFYSGGSALGSAGIDLGHVVGNWWEAYGISDESLYVALRACSTFKVTKAGTYGLYGKDWVKDEQVGDRGNEHRKYAGEKDPKSKPSTIQTIDVRPATYGQRVNWDENSDTVRELMLQGGLALVEEVYTRSGLGKMALGLDKDLKTGLDALTLTGRTAAATAAQWSTASSGKPVTHLAAAVLGFPIDPDSMIISRKTFHYMVLCDEWTEAFGGTAGIGRLNMNQVSEGLANFGIRNLYIGETDVWGDAVYLYRRGGSDNGVNPIETPSAVVMATIMKEGSDERGVLVKLGDDPENSDGHWTYPQVTADFGLDDTLIGSVTDTY